MVAAPPSSLHYHCSYEVLREENKLGTLLKPRLGDGTRDVAHLSPVSGCILGCALPLPIQGETTDKRKHSDVSIIRDDRGASANGSFRNTCEQVPWQYFVFTLHVYFVCCPPVRFRAEVPWLFWYAEHLLGLVDRWC